MEITSNFKHHDHTSPLNSPTTSHHHHNNNNNQPPSLPITRSDPNSPYPTTFVTADTSSFKQVVQMLTGSSDSNSPKPQHQHQSHDTITPLMSTTSTTITTPTTPPPPTTTISNHTHYNYISNSNNTTTTTTTTTTKGAYTIPPIKTTPKKQGFKLYERRNSIKNLISPLTSTTVQSSSSSSPKMTSFSPRYKQEILSPSLLDFPSLTLSPVTPLVEDPFDKTSSSPSCFGPGLGPDNGPKSSSDEEKAIAEKGFFLHPSPVSTPRDSQPQLLPLFPLSSPRISNP